MKTPAHSPGPWKKSGARIIGYPHQVIADVSPPKKGCMKANAFLIAAAPDLFATLKDLLLASENADETGYVDGEGWLPLEEIQDRARAAIQKATQPK